MPLYYHAFDFMSIVWYLIIMNWITKATDKDTRLTLTVPEAAELLGIGRNAAYEAVKRGDIPSLRFGRTIVVPRAQLSKLLEGAHHDPTQRTDPQ
jgi:excisionase family DNA binding protein